MASLRDQFEHFYVSDEDAEKTAIQTGLVTPDTNVLLNLYRFQAGARDELFGALEKLGERLWIPHQVALEFYRRRLDVIAEQEKYFNDTRKDLTLVGDLRESRDVRNPNRLGRGSHPSNQRRHRLAAKTPYR